MTFRPIVQGVRKGQAITGRLLTSYADTINSIGGRVASVESQILDGDMLQSSDAERVQDSSMDVSGTVFVERGRQTETVRVTNPDDEDQYVDVARISSIQLVSQSGERMTLVFNNPTE